VSGGTLYLWYTDSLVSGSTIPIGVYTTDDTPIGVRSVAIGDSVIARFAQHFTSFAKTVENVADGEWLWKQF
jgi:hypothetical protein